MFSPIELEIYPNNSFYIGKIKIDDELIKESSSFSDLETIIILDRSGSMGSSTYDIVKKILPKFFQKLGYSEQEKINLITFSQFTEQFEGNYEEISKSNVCCLKDTFLLPALRKLYSLIEYSKKKKFRILTISDGILNDQIESMNFSNSINDLIKQKQILINSQAIRFFTSNEEPDTRGLSSLLQLNNVSFPILEDIYCSLNNEIIIEQLINLFINDGLSRDIKLVNTEGNNVFLIEPWDNPNKEIDLNSTENIFYIDKNFGEKISHFNNELNCENLFIYCKNNSIKIPVKIIVKDKVTNGNYLSILERKLKFYLQKIKILKIVNTEESILNMEKIIEFFKNFENSLLSNEIVDNKISSRIQYIENTLKKKKNEFSNLLQNIKNNDKINELNSRQQAEYLKKLNLDDKSSKQLAKRAINKGINYDEELIKEVKLMKEHLNEINDIDDTTHTISFYSTCTTLDGIKEVCNIKEDLLEKLTSMDILKLINIVGIAIYQKYDNYIDPMLYRIEKLYQGTFVSISDIIMAMEVSGGKNLSQIGNPDNIITNVIPIYDDERIHLFLLKYAKKILEYSSSIGMRKLIADIPYTYEYTLLSGLWKLLGLLLKDKSEVNIKLFIKLIISYQNASGNHFNYVIELIKKQKNLISDKSLFIDYNTMFNMTNPICYFVNNIKDDSDKNLIKRILRSIYQFEVYQFFRTLRRKQNPNDLRTFNQNLLNDLCSIDFEKNTKKVTPLFEKENNDKTYDKYEINDFKLDEFLHKLKIFDIICIVPQFLKCAFEENPVENFKKIQINNIDENLFKENLGIEYDLRKFKFFCVVQSLIYKEKKDRCDVNMKEMLIDDLVNENKGEEMVKNYVISQYESYFNNLKVNKSKEEEKILSIEFNDKFIKCENNEGVENLLKNGILKGETKYILKDISDKNYNLLIGKLLNKKENNIPLRGLKIIYLITGRKLDNNILWNKGNINLNLFEKNVKDFIIYLNDEEKKFYYSLKTKFSYQYREGFCNRLGHSNEKKSYWALGYKSLNEMASIVDKQTMDEYKKIHYNCCGLNVYNKVLPYKIQKKKNLKKAKK